MEEKEVIIGVFNAHERGFGFVTPEGDEEQKDIFIPWTTLLHGINTCYGMREFGI